jgi:hypothetical protein
MGRKLQADASQGEAMQPNVPYIFGEAADRNSQSGSQVLQKNYRI